MRRRQYLTAGVTIAAGAIAGCLGDDEEVFSIQPGDDQVAAEVSTELDSGDYELVVSFDEYDPSGEGIDEPLVSFQLSDGDFTDTVVDVELTEEGETTYNEVTIEDSGDYVAVLQVPTTESTATATLEHA